MKATWLESIWRPRYLSGVDTPYRYPICAKNASGPRHLHQAPCQITHARRKDTFDPPGGGPELGKQHDGLTVLQERLVQFPKVLVASRLGAAKDTREPNLDGGAIRCVENGAELLHDLVGTGQLPVVGEKTSEWVGGPLKDGPSRCAMPGVRECRTRRNVVS